MSKVNDTPARLLDVKEVAGILNCSTRHVYRLTDGGKMPRPLHIGNLVRWPQKTINDWIDAGCKPIRPSTTARPTNRPTKEGR
jgi:excisionase family DNA binding protein